MGTIELDFRVLSKDEAVEAITELTAAAEKLSKTMRSLSKYSENSNLLSVVSFEARLQKLEADVKKIQLNVAMGTRYTL